MINYYEVLGLKPNATADEIKAKFRELAQKHHPDRGGDKLKFQEINEAYQILSDPKKRKTFDDILNGIIIFSVVNGSSGFNFGLVEPNTEFDGTIELTYRGDINSKSDLEVKIDWGDPSWNKFFPLKITHDENQKKIFIYFRFRSPNQKGVCNQSIKILATQQGNISLNTKIPIVFSVKRSIVYNVSVPSGAIHIGPLKPGEKKTVKTTVQNLGEPIYEPPRIEEETDWTNVTLRWINKITILQDVIGRFFPFDLQFEVDASGCNPRNETYLKNLYIYAGNNMVGVIPVILHIIKDPVPDLVFNSSFINFGNIDWYEQPYFDLRIDNIGDIPENPIRVSIDNSAFSISSVTPSDATSFPKMVRIFAKSKNPGDYKATLTINDGKKVYRIPIVGRFLSKPQLVPNPSEINLTLKRSGKNLRITVKIDLNGAKDIPTIEVSFQNNDEPTYKPEIRQKGSGFPIFIDLEFDSRALKKRLNRYSSYDVTYRNTLTITGVGSAEAKIQINIPIEITIEK